MREMLLENEDFKDSPLGKIPNNWEIFKMASFASIKYGISDAIDQTLESGVPTITLPCVKLTGELILNKDTLGLTIKNKVFSDDFLKRGDLLFNWRNGSQEHLGKTAYFDVAGEYTHVGFLLRIRTQPDICYSRYLWWRLCFMKYQGFFLKAKSQVNNTFNSAELADVRVILPPLKEQQCITEILDAVDNVIARTSDLITKLKQTKAGLLHDLLTRGLDENGQLRNPEAHPEQFKDSALGVIPKDWNVFKLSEIVPCAEYGISTSLDDEIGIPVLRMNNLKNGEVDLNDLKKSASIKAANLLLQPYNVLFNRTNSIEHVGRTAIWRGQIEKASFASYLVRLIPDQSRLIPEYLNIWLNLPSTQLLIKCYATPGVHQVNVNPTNLRKVLISLPENILEQQSIIDKVTVHDTRIRKEEAYLNKLKLQKQGLMQDLLTGKVRVKSIKQ